MISSANFIAALAEKRVRFFTGVPDSLLKSCCAYITNSLTSDSHIIAANEGNAVGIAIGYHLATGKLPVVYMQNSGLGNAINPLLSLADSDVYQVPMVLLIGWRGSPGVHDEPQHVKQGRVMLPMLDAMEIPYFQLGSDDNTMHEAVANAVTRAHEVKGPVALIAKKNAFDAETVNLRESPYEMSREDAIQVITRSIPENTAVVSTTGMASRELFENRTVTGRGHSMDFLTVGGMGHASQIALGIALSQSNTPVVCIDGDGAALMHLGGVGLIAIQAPANLVHVLLNNGAHASVGGQPTIGYDVNFVSMALALGFAHAHKVLTVSELEFAFESAQSHSGPIFIEVRIKMGHRQDLGRPTRNPRENKSDFMAFLGAQV